MKTLSITDKQNLKHTYQIVCNLLTQITRQQFEVQKVDDPINIADFNIVCNNTWQVLNPKMQEDLLKIKDYDTMHIPAREHKFYKVLDIAIASVCEIEQLKKPHYVLYLDKSSLQDESEIYGSYSSIFDLMKQVDKIFKSDFDTLKIIQDFTDTSGLQISVNAVNEIPYANIKLDLKYIRTRQTYAYWVFKFNQK